MPSQHPIDNEEEENVDDNNRNDHTMLLRSTTKQRLCKPHPFQQYHTSHRYISGRCLDIPESGTLNFIEPCHEFKSFINTPDKDRMFKFIKETIRFAAGCMNSRTNGTIHFGIGDNGEVFGVYVENKEQYGNKLNRAIVVYFKRPEDPSSCIKSLRFVEVLDENETLTNKYVIEVDIVPELIICQDHFYLTTEVLPSGENSKGPYLCYFREGSSTVNRNKQQNKSPKGFKRKRDSDDNNLKARVAQYSQLRRLNEEKQHCVIKSTNQGFRLRSLMNGGRASLDESPFHYIVVTNKSHPNQFQSLRFLTELNPVAILDFDPESAKHGLQHHFRSQMAVKCYLPGQYNIRGGDEGFADETSWIFCNGGFRNEAPSDLTQWPKDKGASVEHLISSLCQKAVFQNKSILVIFLLLSPVTDEIHPLVHTFCAFRKELNYTKQILCVCDNENTFISWKDILDSRCILDISDRCIYELSFAEVNGTVLSLSSGKRSTQRFLIGRGGSNVLLEKEVERSLNTLEILCVNQCEEGHDDKIAMEKNFYRGTKASWWNFHYLDKGESSVLIKRRPIKLIIDYILATQSNKKPCVLVNLRHEPGCGGTTLGMHVLWELRDKFRCAVLKNKHADFSNVADEVNQLLTYGCEDQVPVLLMLDDFDDMNKVFEKQKLIEDICRRNIKSPQVILLNCFRSYSELGVGEIDEQMFFIGNHLSAEEQTLFGKQLAQVEKRHRNVKTFYAFMTMKNNVKPEYFTKPVVHNILRNFCKNQQQMKLLIVLTLRTVNSKDASLPFSVCERLLVPDLKPVYGTNRFEELLGNLSLICSVEVMSDGQYGNVKLIHPIIAKYCFEELTTTHKMTINEMTNLLPEVADLCASAEDKPLKTDPKVSRRFSKVFKKTPGSRKI